MTPNVSSRFRRGAVALGGLLITASAVLMNAPAVYAAPTTDAVNAINDRYAAFGGATSLLGAPIGDAIDAPGGAERDYEGGAIFYSQDTGAHVMYGAILDRYQALGGPGSELGYPTNDESDTGDGTGRFNDFTTPGGASMYWTPQWGASVIKGRVLDAWRESGGIAGPFGYPSADTSVLDGVQTGKFVGPDGTEIQWSEGAGLVTVPAALAATIPGFSATTPTADGPTAEGTTSVTTPSLAPATTTTSPKGTPSATNTKWWWIPVGLAALALITGLLRLMTRKPAVSEPVKVAAQRAPETTRPVRQFEPVTPPPPPVRPITPAPTLQPPAPTLRPPAPPAPPVQRPPAPPVPRPPAPPAPPAPAKVIPLVKTPPPAPRPPAPPAPPAPKPVPVADTVAIRPLLSEPPKATIHTGSVEQEVSAVIKYESSTPADTRIQVTYENNAVGDNQESVADKSDTVPDSREL